jgi:hypothetical protein
VPDLFWIPSVFAVDPTTARRARRFMLLVFWPLVLLTLVALALQLGAWRKEYKIAGPFAAETSPARHSLILAAPQDMRPKWWVESLSADDNRHPHQSDLRLWIDGHEMGPPHTLHETIRDGGMAGFSHWDSHVFFSLPPSVRNAPETIATLGYRVRPPFWLTLALTVASGLLARLLYGRAIGCFLESHEHATAFVLRIPYFRDVIASSERYEPAIVATLRIPYWLLAGLSCVALIASAVFVTLSLYALATGWALPTTALILWSPVAQWAAQNEPYLGYLLLSCAGLGAIATWLARLSPNSLRIIQSDELSLRRLLFWCGFPIAASAFVFCTSAMWAGIVRPGDPHFTNIGGLLPFSDAAAYLTAAHDQAKDGFWNNLALRRPLAAAFRSVLLVFGNFSLQLMLILQACLIAGAVCFATHAVARWRGIWAGAAFFGLTYIYDRHFVPTTLTEPFGLFWALLSIPFFIEAFVSGSVRPAILAFTITSVALMTRMGSMLTIPAVLVWLVWQFGQGTKAKLGIFAVSIGILLGILGLNSLLQNTYGTGPSPVTGNFAYVACGLTKGTDWRGCLPKLASEDKTLGEGEEALASDLYAMAWENLRAAPGVFVGRLADGAVEFVTRFPDVIWKGYGAAIREPDWLWRNSLTAVSLIGLLYIAMRTAKAVELTFWTLFLASVVASSSLVYFDDGSRTLAASHPLIALFFAMGMSGPLSALSGVLSGSRLSRYGALGLITAAALFACVPWMAHRFSPIEAMVGDSLVSKQDEAFVFGGRRMSGFLVVEDGLPLRDDVPTLHLADFEAIIEQSLVETYGELLHPVMPPLPFGFVFAPRLEKGVVSRFQYIVPAEVVERRDVPAWHFHLNRWGYKPDVRVQYWFYVTKAEPLH